VGRHAGALARSTREVSSRKASAGRGPSGARGRHIRAGLYLAPPPSVADRRGIDYLSTPVLVAIDTSVLVAGALVTHPRHAHAWPWIEAVERGEIEGLISIHTLAELYSELTRLPQGMSPHATWVLLNHLRAVYQVIPLTSKSYAIAVERCATRSLTSESIFDALHVVAAEQAGADILLTFDDVDFGRLSDSDLPKIVVPTRTPWVST